MSPYKPPNRHWEAAKEWGAMLLLIWAIPFIGVIAYELLRVVGMGLVYILTHQ